MECEGRQVRGNQASGMGPEISYSNRRSRKRVDSVTQCPGGLCAYGPYLPLMEGRYEARIHFVHDLPVKGQGVIDVCADSGRRVLGQAPFDAAALHREEPCIRIEFRLERSEKDVEVRLNCVEGFSGCIERLELTELSPGTDSIDD